MPRTPLEQMKQLVQDWTGCQRCGLCNTRTQVVHGRGAVPADILFVGEAPGDSEDVVGLPFVGPAGNLMDQIIAGSVPTGVTFAITNLVGCIPRDEEGRKSGQPEYEEILSCMPRLEAFIRIVDPKLVVSVGKVPSEFMVQGDKTNVRFHRDIPQAEIVHPSFILTRMPFAQRSLAVRRAIVTIATAIAKHVTCTTDTDGGDPF